MSRAASLVLPDLAACSHWVLDPSGHHQLVGDCLAHGFQELMAGEAHLVTPRGVMHLERGLDRE